MTRPPKPHESVKEFAQSFLTKYPSARPVPAPSCPTLECVAFDIQTSSTYAPEGGAHFMVVAFSSDAPQYPGLKLEMPAEPPKDGSTDEVKYFRPEVLLQRLDGLLYTIVMLDSTAVIYDKAAADYKYLLSSLQVE